MPEFCRTLISRLYRHRIVVTFFIVVVIISAAFIYLTRAQNSNFRVVVLDVGQGDAILIDFPDGNRWLIDGGPDGSVVDALHRQIPWGDNNLTGLILTHPQADHVTGLVDVIKRYYVGSVVMPPVEHTSPVYLAWLEKVRDQNIKAVPADKPFVWEGEVEGTPWRWEFLHPTIDDDNPPKDLNDVSIVSRLIIGEVGFLFMGDAPVSIERLLVDQGRDLSADVLKVGHHGSDTSSGQEFLEVVAPNYAAISVGSGNRFGHPKKIILKRLQAIGAEVLRTDLVGDIIFTTDGQSLSVSVSN